MSSIFDLLAQQKENREQTAAEEAAKAHQPTLPPAAGSIHDLLARFKPLEPLGEEQKSEEVAALRERIIEQSLRATEELKRDKAERKRRREEQKVMGNLAPEVVEATQAWTSHEGKYADDKDDKTAKRVDWSPECERIIALPVWDWHEDPRLEEWIEQYTNRFKRIDGQQEARPVQAAMLFAMAQCGGAFGAIGVGEGKTLITYVAPRVFQARNPVLIVPAKLVGKTHKEFAVLAKHWLSSDIQVVSYQKISRNPDHLEELAPDLVMLDEAHNAKNPRAACTRRIGAYRQAHPEVPYVVMSGTMASRSILNFAHLMEWAVGPRRLPLPRNDLELSAWARALDEKVKKPLWIGDLNRFLAEKRRKEFGERITTYKDAKGMRENPTDIQEDMRNAVREAMGDRFNKTKGVVYTRRASVDASIYMELFDAKLTPPLRERLDELQEEKKELVDIPEKKRLPFLARIWQKARQACCGFQYVWDPEPPEDWREAKSAWHSFVLEVVKQELPKLDSASQIAAAAKRGDLGRGSQDLYSRWKSLEKKFKPNVVPQWLDKAPLYAIADHVKEPTLIWTEFQAVGYALAEIMGLPFFHRKGIDQNGNAIEDLDPSSSAILSIASNSEGRNLQAWNHNLVLTPMASGKEWEQVMGRSHRAGQLEDAVYFKVMMGCRELHDSLDQAFLDAEFLQRITKNPQKLLLVDLISSK